MTSNRYLVCACVVFSIIILHSYGLTQANSNPRVLPFPEVQLGPNGEGAEGNLWLSWSDGERLGFSRGYVQGYIEGWRRACSEAAELTPDNSYLYSKCISLRGDLLARAEFYRDTATEFYSKYPMDRALPINRLFQELLKPGITAQKIHQWLDGLIADSKKASSK